ncbi:hypothetical protein K7X08_010170 [Anisodus acutangulus]|uniref:Uncharacterized protein n=1 Tax=Anisodus acutangulus TaxID=402998 RepID=A0A9Q1N0U4_9SOLA|nr:hypothetical protein K7X08_010170 [Anisodus acutangulus]
MYLLNVLAGPPKALDEDETEFLEKLDMDQTLIRRKNPQANPLGMIVKVKPRAKKAKIDLVTSDSSLTATKASNDDRKQPSSDVDNVSKFETEESQRLFKRPIANADNHEPGTISSLVSYSDDE